MEGQGGGGTPFTLRCRGVLRTCIHLVCGRWGSRRRRECQDAFSPLRHSCNPPSRAAAAAMWTPRAARLPRWSWCPRRSGTPGRWVGELGEGASWALAWIDGGTADCTPCRSSIPHQLPRVCRRARWRGRPTSRRCTRPTAAPPAGWPPSCGSSAQSAAPPWRKTRARAGCASHCWEATDAGSGAEVQQLRRYQ